MPQSTSFVGHVKRLDLSEDPKSTDPETQDGSWARLGPVAVISGRP